MNSKKIPGRTAIFFPVADGILVDRILETEPWRQIDNFVQYNFVQNIAKTVNERVTLDPKSTPADTKSPGKKRITSASVRTRKSQTGQIDDEKSAKKKQNALPAVGGRKTVGRKKEAAKKTNEEQGKKEASTNRGRKVGTGDDGKGEEKKPKAVARNSKPNTKCVEENPKVAVNQTEKPSADSQKLEAGSECIAEENKTAESSKRTEETVVSWPVGNEKSTILLNDKVANAERNRSAMSVNTLIGANSKSPFRTSTPKREASRTSGFLGTKPAVAKHHVSTLEKDSSIRSNASAMKACTRSTCARRNAIYGNEEFVTKGNEDKKISAKCECKPTNTLKVKGEKKLGNNETSRTLINKNTTKARYKNTTSTERKSEKFEKRLLEQRKMQEERKIRRHEREAERAMERFSHHVTYIAKKKGYIPEHGLSIDTEDEDSYSDCTSGSY
ncbi:PREDICTED: axoneme-associated protein mst101(2)-like [Eufriesea mexicana]|uniref:axoneme-associated protein mst101(2)-like n=1 Tax=Eufriesea mexicana TaxID=516756 RepID=UPI00083BBF62|nr:PREDICTED: axoneme-associated protein mst101(2)-like [Eufriesea mexicana]